MADTHSRHVLQIELQWQFSPWCRGLDLSFIGFLPAIAACVSLTLAKREDGELVPHNAYMISIAIYPLEPWL